MTHQIIEHFPGQPLPMEKGVPVDGYTEYDNPEIDDPNYDDERPSTEQEESLREGIEATQGRTPRKLPSDAMNLLHEMATIEDKMLSHGARPERIAARQKKLVGSRLAGIAFKHKLDYDDIFQGKNPSEEAAEADVVDLAAARQAALQKRYDDRLDEEADKLGSYDRARNYLESKEIYDPSKTDDI